MADDEVLLTPKEVAARVRVSRDTVYRWIESRELEALDLSAEGDQPRWHVSEASLRAFLERRARRRRAV